MQAGTPQAPNELHIAPGSVIPAQLTKTVDAKKAKPGDEVEARVTQDLKSGNGTLVIPKDSKIVGHVTQAQEHEKDQESNLGIVFDHVQVKNGAEAALAMSIQAIISLQALSGGNTGANPNGGADNSTAASAAQQPETSTGAMANSGVNRPGAMTGATPPPQTQPAGGTATDNSQATSAHEPITGNTQGVVGISNTKLSPGSQGAQGNVVVAEKGNVKLEGGTLLLLKVER
jgi:hypothetical protein